MENAISTAIFWFLMALGAVVPRPSPVTPALAGPRDVAPPPIVVPVNEIHEP
jgi:hypothetical protein